MDDWATMAAAEWASTPDVFQCSECGEYLREDDGEVVNGKLLCDICKRRERENDNR